MKRSLSIIQRYPLLAFALTGIAAFIVFAVADRMDVARWVGAATVVIAILVTAISMILDIVKGHFGLDILALVAMVATLAVGEILASLIIVLMLSGGEALEEYASHRASRELDALLDRSPSITHRYIEGDASRAVLDVPVAEVAVGDTLLVRPSEVIPVNGTLLTAEAVFDESSITGESLPVTRYEGEELRSGVLNGDRAITLRATHTSEDSEYQNILKLVREAQESQAPVVRLADRYAVPFTVVSLIIAGLAWAISGDPLRFAQVLVLATPCPLLIAAPVAFMGGLSRAAASGIVVKSGAVLEQLAAISSIAFDKTGTLTAGQPELVDVRPEPGFTRLELFTFVASAEQYSSHVLADGILRAATREGIVLHSAERASEEATHGVSAVIDGREVRVGKHGFVDGLAPAHRAALEAGELAAYVSVDGTFAGTVILSDAIRPDAAPLIDWLAAEGVAQIAILSGDASATVASVAQQVGIETAHAELLPQDKVRLMSQMPAASVMVGDGVNDAPVLATADVGIAMGARGSTAAGEAADIVILTDSIGQVASAISISTHTLRVALQAIWIGIALSIGLMLVATTGIIPAVAGAFIQEIVDLVAILYALRTLRGKLPDLKQYSSLTREPRALMASPPAR